MGFALASEAETGDRIGTGICIVRKGNRCTIRLSLLLLWVSSLAACPPLVFSQSKDPVMTVPPSIMWTNLLSSLHELKRLRAEEQSERIGLQNEIQLLSNLLTESQADLQIARSEGNESTTLLTASLQQSENLKRSITSLTRNRDRHRLAWQIGVPVAFFLGAAGGIYVASR